MKATQGTVEDVRWKSRETNRQSDRNGRKKKNHTGLHTNQHRQTDLTTTNRQDNPTDRETH